MNKQKKSILKIIFYLLTSSIILISVIPQKNTIREIENIRIDYIEHFLALMLWGLLFTAYLLISYRINKFLHYLFIIFIGLSFTFLIEFIQYFIPYRSFNPIDFYMNLSGFSLGFLITFLLNKLKLSKNE